MSEIPEHSAENERHGGGVFRVFVWIAVALVLYVLSVGPVLKFAPISIFQPPLGYIYWPVLQLGMPRSPVSRVFFWYVNDVWRCGLTID
jgi:hypothetical protein